MQYSTKSAIRNKCINCCGERKNALHCSETTCPLHKYLLGGTRARGEEKETRMKCIKAYCRWCSGGNYSEVRECPCTRCPLYKYRFGKVNKDDKKENN